MKRLFTVFLMFASLLASAQEVITFMPQWSPQSQFAGYYMAMAKGFYDEEGLTVVIDHFSGSSSDSAIENLKEGNVDIITAQLINALVARSKGVPLVNVLQTSQVSGLRCVSHYPIDSVGSLAGKRIGRWKVGHDELCELFCQRNALEVEWIPFIQGINLFISRAVDAMLCYSYSEFIQLELATGGIREYKILRFSETGLDFPEDGLYVTERYYRKHKDAVDRFVRASRKGWDYAREHPDEALDVTLGMIRDYYRLSTNKTLQRLMLEEVLRLQVNPATGKADYAPVSEERFDELCGMLFDGGIIRSRPTYKEMIK